MFLCLAPSFPASKLRCLGSKTRGRKFYYNNKQITRAPQQPLTAGPRSQEQGQRARVEGPSFRVSGVSGRCLIAGPKLRLPCPESLISSPRLQHPAFNLRSQDTDQNPKCLASGPRFEFQSQVHGVVFLSAHATVRDMRSNASNGLGSVRRTSQAGAALKNESYCCSFLSGIQLFIDIRNMGEFESQQNLFCVFYVHCFLSVNIK